MKKNLNYRPHVLTVTRDADKSTIKRFLDLEKHPRQKQSSMPTMHTHLPIHLMF